MEDVNVLFKLGFLDIFLVDLEADVGEVVLVVHPANAAETVVLGGPGHQDLLFLLVDFLHPVEVIVHIEI